MGNLIKYSTNFSKENEIDFYYQELMKEFLQTLTPSYNRTNITLVLNQLYTICLEDPFLKSKKDGSLLISKITINHILQYQQLIELGVKKNEISKHYGKNILFYVRLFCKFLTNKQLVNLFYKPINFFTNDPKSNKNQKNPLLSEFTQFLETRHYAKLKNYHKAVKKFLVFSSYNPEVTYDSSFWEEQIKNYEDSLRNEVILEKITSPSAYQYLKCIRLFYDFLYEEKMANFKYKISKTFETKANRSNEYVNYKDILILIEKILERSTNTLRDISFFLIILETGCRPIEVVNLELDDIVLAERLITLKSKKSHQRTLKISKDLIEFLQEYLKVRCNYSPSVDTKSLFLNRDGTPLTTTTIYDCFRKNNLRAFGKHKFTPKSLRHTFITNALNNKNDINDVSKTVGHKYLSTTMRYFYRDLQSIKQMIVGKELNFDKEENR